MTHSILTRVKYSPLGRLAALPLRLRIGLTPLVVQTGQVARWLVRSREWANFNYDYEPEGLDAIFGAVAELTGRSHADLRGYAEEIKNDTVFAERYAERVRQSRLRWTCDPTLRYGRCLINYMLVRATGARFIFEAGTEHGLSTWAMCRALHRNGVDRAAYIVTVDIRSDRGELLDGNEGGLVHRLVGDSVGVLSGTHERIDLFLHDTVNDPTHARAQFTALAPRLAPGAVVYSGWFTKEFVDFCEGNGLRYLEYVERPHDHWYPGRRAGLAIWPRSMVGPAPARRQSA